MSRPQPGTYVIYNRVASATGELLAMTFNGDQQPISVTPLDSLNPRQHVSICGEKSLPPLSVTLDGSG